MVEGERDEEERRERERERETERERAWITSGITAGNGEKEGGEALP